LEVLVGNLNFFVKLLSQTINCILSLSKRSCSALLSMADLRSRLGPKISANKSWIRPGYEIPKKSSFTKLASQTSQDDAKEEFNILGASWKSESTLAGHSIDNGDNASCHPDAPGKNAISLLQRVEMQTQDHEDADNLEDKHVEKSLFDRIGSAPEKSANGVLSGFGSSWVGNRGLTNNTNGERNHWHVGNPSLMVSQAVSDSFLVGTI
jgi:hypothetical protein